MNAQPEPALDARPSIAEANAMLTAPGEAFEMSVVDIRGVPTRVWKHTPPTLRDVLESGRTHGDRAFLVYENERLTFEQHHQAVVRLAWELRDQFGVRHGDRVAIAMRNYPEWSMAFFATTALGAVAVPLNAWWTGPELAFGLADSDAKVLFADRERAHRIAPHLGELTVQTVFVVRAEGAAPAGMVDFSPEADGVTNLELPPADVEPEDAATIFYTSGTTGTPKGALGTNRNICCALTNLAFSQARSALREADPQVAAAARTRASGSNVYLLSVPFFHATGCHAILVANLYFGGRVVLMYKWDPTRALELIETEGVTTFGGVPVFVSETLSHPDFSTYDTSSIRSIAYGGAPAPPELLHRIDRLLPGRIASNGYGLTETSSIVAAVAGSDYRTRPSSCVGAPVAVCEIMVVDDDDTPVATGELGEIWIKGPNVVDHYFQRPDATASTFTNGWLRTGDLGKLDDEGFLYILDRLKDIIIRGGENVYCAEVEAALLELDHVADATVFGVPHESLGEAVAAVLQTAKGSRVDVEVLRAQLAVQLAKYKVPTHIWLTDEPLPRNAGGKVLKREVRKRFAGVLG